MSELIDFYRGNIRHPAGYYFEEIFQWRDDRWEADHTYVQFVFPLPESSNFNADAPLLTEEDISIWKSDPVLQANLRRAFRRFLHFIGLDIVADCVTMRPDFYQKAVTLVVCNHNWFRISRVLRSLTLLGAEKEALALFQFLDFLNRVPNQTWQNAFSHWRKACNKDDG